jgi:hypothetical protein
MSDLVKLRQEHAELIEIARKLDVVISKPSPPSQVELFNLRRELTSTLIAHLKAEDWVLYPRLLSSKDPNVAATANAFIEEMGGLAAAFAGYNDKWPAPAIHANWAGYCEHSGAIIAALTNRISRENRELYPLLEAIDKAA